jgi:hypothetical protein
MTFVQKLMPREVGLSTESTRKPHRYDPYYGIITKHLDARDNDPDVLAIYMMHPDFPGCQRYVVDMCHELCQAINQRGGHCSLEDVLRMDSTASGHVDYHVKFALYCHELEKEKSNNE